MKIGAAIMVSVCLALSALAAARVVRRFGKTDDGKWTVTLSTDKPAFWVWANAKNVRGEFSDNAFTLMPGEDRTLVFEPKDKSTTFADFKRAFSVTHLRRTYRGAEPRLVTPLRRRDPLPGRQAND